MSWTAGVRSPRATYTDTRHAPHSGSYTNSSSGMSSWSSTSRFPMHDDIGSARRLLDASGAATDWYELDTFGRQVSSSGTTPNPYRFGAAWGYITDPSGMLQLGARFYWPEVGRFVQQDPMEDAVNWYGYAESNPVRRADPSGLKSCPAFEDYFDCMAACKRKYDRRIRNCWIGWSVGTAACSAGFVWCIRKKPWAPGSCRRAWLTCVAAVEAAFAACLLEAITFYEDCVDDCYTKWKSDVRRCPCEHHAGSG